PQRRSRILAFEPLSVCPQLPLPAPLVKSRSVGTSVVVVVVDSSVVVVVDSSVVVVGGWVSVVVVGAAVVVGGAGRGVVGAAVVVLPQGSGEHVPGPRFAPSALEHCVAVSTMQVKAPSAEPGTQHWIGGSVVVVVVGAPVLVLVEDVVVVLVGDVVVGAS